MIIISLTSTKLIQAFYLLLGFAENQGIFWDFNIKNSFRITKGSHNGDLDNQGSFVYISLKLAYTKPSELSLSVF